MNNVCSYGLPAQVVLAIQQVLSQYPQVRSAVLYGSRAKGNFREGSDIDLTLKTDPTADTALLLQIENQLDELNTPYQFDLSLFHHITNPGLIEHISRVGVNFYSVAN
jgi:type I restriction enzyme R subunit